MNLGTALTVTLHEGETATSFLAILHQTIPISFHNYLFSN